MPTIKQRAEAYDALMREILARQPSVDLVADTTQASRLAIYHPETDTERFLWAFDQLVDNHKRKLMHEQREAVYNKPRNERPWWRRVAT